ncbi:MAG: ABC transporter substrate-binding protein [Oscillospiraceae bacterium]|nr:ABC transporter substrate-binding protein [Oscillospiraceae bacterium]
MNRFSSKFIALILAISLLGSAFSGCGLFGRNVEPVEDDYENGYENMNEIGPDRPTPVAPIGDGRFTIGFVAGDPLNPFTTVSRDNLAVGGLLYEGLFALDDNFTATPVLAHNLTTVDGIRYTLELRQDITFHNGIPLTAEDVIYSLTRARDSAFFGGRLSIVAGYDRRVDAEGYLLPHEMEITLNRVHGNLPVLLTFPIIQYGTMGWTVPPGTGPYAYSDDAGQPRLLRFANHWYEELSPLDTIYLTEIVSIEQLTAHVNSGILNLVALDPTATVPPRFSVEMEVRSFEATLMDYIGFNINRPETGRLEVRQAISRAIDRAYITDNIMFGNAVSSPLPIHPSLTYYDHALAAEFAFDFAYARTLLDTEPDLTEDAEPETDTPDAPAPEDDPDLDDQNAEEEEYPDEEPSLPQLSLLVAGDSTARMEVAVYIAESVAALGYQVIIVDLPYDEYLEALQAGRFDLFYAQVRLQPDFDLTDVLFRNLAFGGIHNLVDRQLLDDFLAADHLDRGQAASAMCAAILEAVPISVIGFRHLAVATHRGLVTGLRPTQENLFRDVFYWSVALG